MNGAKYGKGDRPRNNWGQKWYDGYNTIVWSRTQKPTTTLNLIDRKNPPGSLQEHPVSQRRG